jgi:hypothetical protein
MILVSPESSRRRLGPTNLKSTVGQYSRTDHTNTVNNITVGNDCSLERAVQCNFS